MTTQQTKLIYVGPNTKNGVLMKYTVFKGGIPSHIQELFEKKPNLKYLFVPIQNMAKAQQDINTLGTPLNKYYQEALGV